MKRSIAAVAALLCLAFAAQAQTLADVKKRGAVRIGYSETSVPFSFKDKDGEPAGYSVELCKRVATAIATNSGGAVKVEWVPLTPATRRAPSPRAAGCRCLRRRSSPLPVSPSRAR